MQTHVSFVKKAQIILAKGLIFAMSLSFLLSPAMVFAVGGNGTISGTITSGGLPVSGANISILGLGGGAPSGCENFACFAQTDASGNYTISNVPEFASWNAVVDAAGYMGKITSNVSVTESSTTTLDISLVEGTGSTVSGSVTYDGSPFTAGGWVIFLGFGSGSWGYADMDSNGDYSVSGLSTGTFLLHAESDDETLTYTDDAFVVAEGANAGDMVLELNVGGGGGTPQVIYQGATPSQTSANLTGSISNTGTSNVTEIGVQWGLTTSYGTGTSATAGAPYSTGDFTLSASGLTCNTTYHYRAYAVNSSGTGYSGDMTFTTTACPASVAPTVTTTDPPTSITGTTAIFGGNITATGDGNVTERGFQWGTTVGYGTNITFTSGQPFSTGAFTSSVAPTDFLTCGTTYHYRAYATNSAGTGYGSDVTFSSGACGGGGSAPSMSTESATDVTQTSVVLNGNITSTGTANVTERGFQWGVTDAYGTTISLTAGFPFSTGMYSSPLSSLTCGTSYNYRAYAVNSVGTTYGTNIGFGTSACVTSGSISGTVTFEGSPVSGVLVQTTPSGSYSAFTDESGDYTISGIPAGTYALAASKLGYLNAPLNNIVVTAGQETSDINFSLNFTPQNFVIRTGTAEDYTEVTQANVTVGEDTCSTGMTNHCSIVGLEVGSHSINVMANDYEDYNGEFTAAFPATPVFIYMTAEEGGGEPSSTGSIRGTVYRSSGGVLVSGASVTVNPGNYTTTTNSSGIFSVTGLAAGTYSVSVSASTFTSQTNSSVTVTSDNETAVSFAMGEDETGDFTVSEIKIYSDRIIIRLNHGAVEGVFDCSNYLIDGESPECMWGGGTAATGFNSSSAFEKKPFIEYMGEDIVIKNLEISGEVTFAIPADNGIKNGSGSFLQTYTTTVTVEESSFPSITDFSPRYGSVGSTITITGENFGTLGEGEYMGDSNHKVLFDAGWNNTTYQPNNPVEATYVGCTGSCSWSNTQIKIKVPTGAKSGPLKIVAGGVMSDADYNSFFDVSGSYSFKVYYGQNGDTSSLMPDSDASNIRVHIGGMNGDESHYVGDGYMTYDASSDTFTITGVSTMGWTFVYDVTGAHLSSDGAEITTAGTRNIFIPTSYKTVSGTITFGSSCTAAGQNKDVAVFPSPQQVDFGSEGFKMTQPVFLTTNSECTVDYIIGVPASGVYRIETHIPMDKSSTVTASQFVDPEALTVSVNGANVTGQNFTYTSATHRIVGTISKPSGSFGDQEREMLWVWAYQPRENGKGTGTQVGDDNKFTLYVTPGVWKVGVGGANIQYPIEVSIEVDDTYAIDQAEKGPTIVIAPPSDFIEGYVKDGNGEGLSNSSVYAWREGGSGGGNAITNSDGYFKLYVQEGTNYHVGANAKRYGFLGEYTGINVTSSNHPTVNFVVSSSSFHAVSGTVTKNGNALPNAFVFITEGEWGQGIASGSTDSSGTYSLTLPDGNNRYIHIGLPGAGDIYKASLGATSADATHNVTITTSTITVRISPASLIDQAFVGVDDPENHTGSFSNTNVASGEALYKEYQIDIKRPSSGSATFYVNSNIPGFGPLGQPVPVEVDSSGAFTESSGTADDGIVEYSLSGYQTVSGTVTGSNVVGSWVWAGSSTGSGGGGPVESDGTFSIKLKNGTYDIGVDKPGYIGSKTEITVDDEDITDVSLELTSASDTITGTVYYPTSAAASGARVWAENGSGGHAFAMTAADGTYTLNVTSGDWTVMSGQDGYYSDRVTVTAPTTGINITLVQDETFDPKLKNEPIVPADGGVVNGEGIKVNLPKNALGTGSTAGVVEVKTTTNVPVTSRTKLVGKAKEITAKNESNQDVKNLSGEATIEFVLSRQDLIDDSITTIEEASKIVVYSWDDTSNNWTSLTTVATLNPATAATIAELDATSAVTLTATTTHFSAFAPMLPTAENAPSAPSNLTATPGDASVSLDWDASAGASKYYIYQKSGDVYPYLNQTTDTSYSVSGLTNGTTYYFKVSAVSSGDAESTASGPVSATPVAAGTKGVTITQSSGSTSVAEGGSTDTYTVVLDAAPSATVTVAVTGSADASVSPTSLSFTTGNWSTPQTVTVTAVDDSTYEGTESSSITHVATSADSGYNGISIGSVSVSITDNDSAPSGGGAGFVANTPLITETAELAKKAEDAKKLEDSKNNVNALKTLKPLVVLTPPVAFKDVSSSHWASDYIGTLSSRGALSGKSNNAFDPDGFITRAELAKVVATSFYTNIPGETDTPFIDVKFSKWYAPYIKFIYEKGIVRGISERIFKPDDYVTRAEALKMILSAYGANLDVDATAAFNDIDSGSWYMPYINYAAANKIVDGYKGNVFNPNGRITRAEVAKITAKLIELGR